MESKLLYDLYICSLIDRKDIMSILKNRSFDIGQVEYYDIIYSDKLDNKEFLNKLSLICSNILSENELKEKYTLVISLFYKRQFNLNIESSLYDFYLNYSKELIAIDFDFWNLISTDWELKKDGFDGISSSIEMIRKYLQNNANMKDLSDSVIINMISS